ncbi:MULTISPECIES: ABC transporter permease [unclassified Halomonas]|uniref:ABC transporter permease n=1 Tax=unclassified Halomonas TaxID=2609666 RepID=UPI0007D9AE3D|nr:MULTISPECIES: ABC transporter permease [unclassified Halomonas]MBT2787301.1 ABC transporter permease [Halomonas sp. ISL-106]MBT2796335.1 ABC transporter permease [Halomonas sp. ISL-104]OAL57516.1 ABC transporter permease [Halomonas sp. ALS9]
MDNVNGGPRRSTRTPWQVTRSVWYAMFMREAISRTMSDRMGWFWMVFEPIAFGGIMIAIRSFISSDRLVLNASFIPWLIAGLLGFSLAREGMLRGMGAVESNNALFTYRQVQPVDPVIVRNFLEGMLRSFIFLIFIAGGLMLGLDMYPDNPVGAMTAWFSLWSLGLGLGLVASVTATLVPEVGKVIRMLSLPLMIISGVIFPLNQLPHWLLEYLMINPIPHGLEMLRLGFFENYRTIHGTSMTYLWLVTLTLNALGLLMHLRFADRLKAQ